MLTELLSTVLVGLVLLCLVILAGKSLVKKKMSGGCCAGCAGCSGVCPKRNLDREKL